MKSNMKNMTEGRPYYLILTFSLPLMAGSIFQQLYTIVDAMVVGKALGIKALATIGAVDWLSWMFFSMIQGLVQGFAILMSQEYGAGKVKQLRKVVGCSAILAAVSSLFLLTLGQLAAKPLLLLLQTPQDIIDDALLYLSVIFLGIPIVMAYNLLACILRALGDSKTPLHAMVVASITNIVLDLLFVLVCRWGILGAAIATLIAQLISIIYCLGHIRKIKILTLSKEDFKFQRKIGKKLAIFGAPMAFQNAMIAIGGMIVQFAVNGCGVIFIAGYTAASKIDGVLEAAAISYGSAMLTYTGQNFGGRQLKRIYQGMKSSVIIAIITSLLIAIVMLIFGKAVLSCFISGTPEAFDQTMEVGYLYTAIKSIFLPVLYILFIIRSTIQGIGNTVIPMISGMIEFVMRTVAVLLLPRYIGQTGIFFAEIAAWVGAVILLIISYFVTMKKVERNHIGYS